LQLGRRYSRYLKQIQELGSNESHYQTTLNSIGQPQFPNVTEKIQLKNYASTSILFAGQPGTLVMLIVTMYLLARSDYF
jgi:hypothetical protein